jgi:hypothetical protein
MPVRNKIKVSWGKRLLWYAPCKRCKLKGKYKDCTCGVSLRVDWMQSQKLHSITWRGIGHNKIKKSCKIMQKESKIR